MLHTERSTRGSARAFVRYDDLLTDWTVPLFEIGRAFDLQSVQEASANHVRAVHAFVDPELTGTPGRPGTTSRCRPGCASSPRRPGRR